MLHKLGVEVTLVGRSPRKDPQFGLVRSSAELVAIAREANYLVLAAPLTDTTRGIVDSTVLRALGSAGYLVNVGRGPLVVESDLVAALQAGELGGAALDVFDIEPLPPKSPLWSMPNVLVSPHMSGNYAGFEEDLVRVFMDNLELWMEGKPLNNVVDPSLGYVPTFESSRSTSCDLPAT
jgi:phosphoglycerate dehydrogenase-like enzyme